jgi:cation diffusion facilitator CzcD-associated flavoprotein CzcO
VRDALDAIVVGAGPAGLAAAACLARRGATCLVLERESTVGATWRRHYDRLHLHTAKRTSALPFLPFPPSTPRYPSREDVVAYLERYAAEHRIAPRFGEDVRAARRVDGGWEVETSRGRHAARHLVVAAGASAEPVLPRWPGMEGFRGTVLHSSRYRNGAPWRGADVLVVGLGNSGGEIAIDLHEHAARPALSVRGPVSIMPRDVLGVPTTTLAIALSQLPVRVADALSRPVRRLTLGDLARLGLALPRHGPLEQIAARARVPLLDVGTVALLRRGAIRLFGPIARFDDGGVVFEDGRRAPFDAVVLATGYRPCLGFLEGVPGPADPDAAAAIGLHYCGFRVVATGVLREIGREARRIAARVRARP